MAYLNGEGRLVDDLPTKSIDQKEWEAYEESVEAGHISAVEERLAAHSRKVADILGKPEAELSTFDLMYPGYPKKLAA